MNHESTLVNLHHITSSSPFPHGRSWRDPGVPKTERGRPGIAWAVLERFEVLVSMPSSWVSGDLLAARLRTGEVYYSMVAVVVLLGYLVMRKIEVRRREGGNGSDSLRLCSESVVGRMMSYGNLIVRRFWQPGPMESHYMGNIGTP